MRHALSCTGVLALLGAGCATPHVAKGGDALAPAGFPVGAPILDLTYAFDNQTIYWPTAMTGFVRQTIHSGMTEGGYFYSAYSFCAPEHGGTHLDAPIHFAEGKSTADKVPLSRLMGPALVVDVGAAAAKDADYLVTQADIENFERAHGAIDPGALVFIRTGWGARWPDRKRYLGDDRMGHVESLHFPGVGAEAARALVTRKVGAVGIDTASIDYGPSKDFIAHRVLLGADIPVFENVASLESLPSRGAVVIALPMKIGGGSGGPVRIVAILPR